MKKTMKFLTALLLANMAVSSSSWADTPIHINPNQLSHVQWQVYLYQVRWFWTAILM